MEGGDMIIQEDLQQCVTTRASEIAVRQITTYGKVDLTKAVEQATEEVKAALDSYMTIMKTMSVKMGGTKTLSDPPTKKETEL